MARIVLYSYLVRFPLGGYLSWILQWLVGFQELGHDVYFLERSGRSNSCFDPIRNTMTDDCSHGTSTVDALLTRFGLRDRWSFVDSAGRYHGLSESQVKSILRSA